MEFANALLIIRVHGHKNTDGEDACFFPFQNTPKVGLQSRSFDTLQDEGGVTPFVFMA